MPLPTPILDDRSFDEIRQELIRRIPVYTREWTDHNASDPGITLLELFSYLGESVLFRFNQIPEATYLAFLDLLDVPLRPAASARGMVTAATRRPEGLLLPMGAEARAGDVAFEALDEVHAWPLAAVVVGKRKAPDGPPPGSEEEAAALAAQDEFLRREGDGGTVPEWTYYEVERLTDEPAAPGAVAVDFEATVDGAIWIAVLATRDTDEAALGDGLLNVGLIVDEEVPSMADGEECPGLDARGNTPGMLWEISAAAEADGVDAGDRYEVVAVEGDSTEGLTRSGVVRLRLPRESTGWGPLAETDPDAAGAGGLPPVLDDEEEAAQVLFWLRGTRLGEGPPVGAFRWIGVNATRVVQNRAAGLEFVGTGSGQEGQSFTLMNAPVVAGTLGLEVQEGGTGGRWEAWSEVDTFAASGPDDRHFIVDLEAGEVRFGDGLRGRPPQEGERIRATGYRHGGGADGNVAAGKVDRFVDFPSLEATNPVATLGGAAGESVAEALERVPGEIRRRDRAVTAGDFRELALMTPGVEVGRAEVLPRVHPHRPTEETPGAVTVVVWPASDPERPGAPMSGRSFLREVCAHLDQKRLITTEVSVVPPTYRRIAAAVGVEVKDGYGVEAVRRWVEVVIRQYLAPLPPYGPEGGGWPLGRRVHAPELEAAALQVEGVHFLAGDVGLAEWDEASAAWVEAPGGIELLPWEVVELAELTVVAGPPLEPGTALGAAEPTGPEVALPLPTSELEC